MPRSRRKLRLLVDQKVKFEKKYGRFEDEYDYNNGTQETLKPRLSFEEIYAKINLIIDSGECTHEQFEEINRSLPGRVSLSVFELETDPNGFNRSDLDYFRESMFIADAANKSRARIIVLMEFAQKLEKIISSKKAAVATSSKNVSDSSNASNASAASSNSIINVITPNPNTLFQPNTKETLNEQEGPIQGYKTLSLD